VALTVRLCRAVSMKNFSDSDGREWTVFEVRRVVSAREGPPVLPNGYSNGWLCFENGSTKRRLVNFPERWREFTEPELRRLLDQARPAPRTTWRLDDLDDPATSANAQT
jgi:hypothetical protein